MSRLERLFDSEDRDEWGTARRAISKDLRGLSDTDRETIMADLDLVVKFHAYVEDCDNDAAFADYVLALDFAYVKYTNATPRTYQYKID